MVQIVGYARVSSVEQSENSYALEQQIQRLKDAGCQRIIQDVKSGATARRKGLQELNKLIRDQAIREVVITRIDRLTRNLTDLREFAQLCQTHNINLRILDQALDLSTPHGKMMLNMLGSLAEWERDLLKDRVDKGIKHQQKEKRVSGVVPFGYKRSDQGKYIPNRDLYKESGKSIWDVSKELISIFLTNGTIKGTCREFELIYGSSGQSRGKYVGKLPPSHVGLKYWLQSPVLRGHLGYYYRSRTEDTILTPNTHDALINDEQWGIIQKHLSILERKKKRQDSPPLPLAGLVFCGLCGGKCKAFQRRSSKALNHHWLCANKYIPTPTCTGCKGIRNDRLEDLVIQAMINKSRDLGNSIDLTEEGIVDSTELIQARNSLLSIEALAPNQYLDEAITQLKNKIKIMELELHTKTSTSSILRAELVEAYGDYEFYQSLSRLELRLSFRRYLSKVVIDSGLAIVLFLV